MFPVSVESAVGIASWNPKLRWRHEGNGALPSRDLHNLIEHLKVKWGQLQVAYERMVALAEDQGELHKRVRDLEGNLSNVEEGVTQATKQMRTLTLERSEGLRGSGAPLRAEVGCRVSPEDQSPTRNRAKAQN